MFERIVEQHVDAGVFLYARREAASLSHRHDARTLGEIDARLEAHLDGLRIAGAPAGAMCLARGREGDVGGIFAAAQRALEAREAKAFAKVLDVVHDPDAPAEDAPRRVRALTMALRWTSLAKARWALQALLAAAAPPPLHALGIAGLAAHGEHPGAALENAVYASDASLRRAGLDAIGALGARELAHVVRGHLDGDAAFEAARASVLLGDPVGQEPLFRIASSGGPQAEAAIGLAVRAAGPVVAGPHLDRLIADGRGRAAIVGAEALGDPRRVGAVIEAMSDPELARRAGAAFTMITGLAIVRDLEIKADPGDEAERPDAGLPLPDPAACASAWEAVRRAAPPAANAVWLLGAPKTADHCGHVLTTGLQPHRIAAALDVALQAPGRPLVDVRAPRW